MRNKKKINALAAMLLGACVMISGAGCGGEEPEAVVPEDVTLIDPAGVGETYEIAKCRNLYDARVYNGLICPYTQEYELKQDQLFDEYAILPGSQVQKGQTIIRTQTEDLDRQIEEMEKRILENEEAYQEFVKEESEPLEDLRSGVEFWGGVVEDREKEKPEEYLPVLDTLGQPVLDDAGNPTVMYNPEYEAWEKQTMTYETEYRNLGITLLKLEAKLEQRAELHELDQAHDQLLLERKKQARTESTLVAGMNGRVANIKRMSKGNYMSSGVPMVAVADLNKKFLKTEYVSKADISRAEQVYAVVDGVHYEVEYEPMEAAEYNRLEEENGKVYTTFYLPQELKDVEVGTYAVVVLINKSKKDALTVSRKAVSRGEEGTFVYVLKNGERVYTPVKTGMQDGLFVEILSGLQEGDQVLSEAEQPTGKTVKTLGTGSISYEFSKNGTLAYIRREMIKNPVEQGTVYLVECNLNYWQQVKKGDVLVRIRVVGDDIELARQEKLLARENERLEELKKEDEEKNAKEIRSREKTIAKLEEKIAEMNANYAVTEIRAPYDGVITGVSRDIWQERMKEGDLIPAGYSFAVLSPQDGNYVSVEDENGLLTYGNHAVVEYTSIDGTMKTAEGEVVTLNPYSVSRRMFEDAAWEYSDEKPSALIRMPKEVMSDMAGSYQNNNGWWSESTYRVKVTTRKMDNVLLIPKRAVVNNTGSTYARIRLADGTVMLQGFVAGGSDSENYWVVEGLTEGMEVCTE